MPRENSFSDSEGRSLTPDLEDEFGQAPASPTYSTHPIPEVTRPTISTSHPHAHFTAAEAAVKATSMRSFKSPTSIRSKATTRHTHTRLPNERFRRVVRKVIAMHRGATTLSGGSRVGAEPGVDPRRSTAEALFGGIRQECFIEVFDYNSVRSSYGRLSNLDFVNMMDDDAASMREPWVKVRWINIGGVSWDVIKAVSIRYNLHPLALEDVFHSRTLTRSKADYFTRHLFLRVLCHELGAPEPLVDPTAQAMTDLARSSSPEPMTEEDELNEKHIDIEMNGGEFEIDDKASHKTSKSRRHLGLRKRVRTRGASTLMAEESPGQRRIQEEAALLKLKEKTDRVSVKTTPFFIFLLRDGTVISMHASRSTSATSPPLTAPITRRLHQRDTVLRTSADPSFLVQSLLDLLVDKALEVVDAYHAKVMQFEREVLIKPKLHTVTNLHILSEDLILLKRTLEPIKTMVYGLRRYDVDRCAALVDSSKTDGEQPKVVGYMSHKSKIYLADVYDHMEYILSSMDMFAGIGENLIDYTFNMKSYEMNEVMRTLTLVTIIFLPLTLLTGYFGMNFTGFWAVEQNSDVLFWIIALPVMAVVIPLATWRDILGIIHYVQKKVLAKNAVKAYKRD